MKKRKRGHPKIPCPYGCGAVIYSSERKRESHLEWCPKSPARIRQAALWSRKCFLCFRTVEKLWVIHLNANHTAAMEAYYRGECFVCDECADLCILRGQTHGGRTNPDIDDEASESAWNRTFSLQKAIDDAIMDTKNQKRKETSNMKKRKRISTKKRTILLPFSCSTP